MCSTKTDPPTGPPWPNLTRVSSRLSGVGHAYACGNSRGIGRKARRDHLGRSSVERLEAPPRGRDRRHRLVAELLDAIAFLIDDIDVEYLALSVGDEAGRKLEFA